jgi:hypothetical protein
VQGLTEHTKKIFDEVSKLDSIKEYTLVGGTAIALQLGHRLSEDLDFCKWSTNIKYDKPIVEWNVIEKELKTIGKVITDVNSFEQVDFELEDVKLIFFVKQENLSPVTMPVPILNNIKAADLYSLGAMKVELLLRRSSWRDYYDIYSLLKHGLSIKEIINLSGTYSNHSLRSRNAISFLSNSNNYPKESGFDLLNPMYNVTGKEIENLIKTKIIQEYQPNSDNGK